MLRCVFRTCLLSSALRSLAYVAWLLVLNGLCLQNYSAKAMKILTAAATQPGM